MTYIITVPQIILEKKRKIISIVASHLGKRFFTFDGSRRSVSQSADVNRGLKLSERLDEDLYSWLKEGNQVRMAREFPSTSIVSLSGPSACKCVSGRNCTIDSQLLSLVRNLEEFEHTASVLSESGAKKEMTNS